MQNVIFKKGFVAFLFGAILLMAWLNYFIHGINIFSFRKQETARVSQAVERQTASSQVQQKRTQTNPSDLMTVYIIGAVQRPGLYHLPLDARIDVALRAAGGPTLDADLAAINLAAVVEDGMEIVIPSLHQGSTVAGTSAFATVTTSQAIIHPRKKGKLQEGERISLNRANLQMLMEIPGIGEKKAERILMYKASHGAFTSLSQLREVQGMGEKLLAKIFPYLTL
ncbi:helix-hairpin-helix domain-containing protein [Sulfoacidibacillus thermotolerans]|uniref:Helix-hairpin-helix DNA-binding motif class 1 domain-containing protein n=1 Tax=Sulfoacidibacillus thermotolerans TaxID=1765684 RepID=A0A2U3D7D5_SULT2|nr:helix-hairpin-helix domain-containing protein [Sulfoacidibacillus thermotolerans]PWI57187.1 hypothetical protein BM613_09980 [Sulfoacidibacillus thermotolerans]